MGDMMAERLEARLVKCELMETLHAQVSKVSIRSYKNPQNVAGPIDGRPGGL